jgi:Cu/Ag efflux pump CusA
VARQIKAAIDSLPEVANTFIPEESDYPTINVKVDRVKAARLGLDQRDVVTNLITALTSNAWRKRRRISGEERDV